MHGVSINAVVGENGIITQAQNATMAMEEAEVWEKIQMILIDAMGSDLEGEELCDYVNAQFEAQGIDAMISYLPDNDQYAYVVTYGIYSRYSAYLDKNLNVLLTVAAVEGTINNDEEGIVGDWNVTLLSDGTYKILSYVGEKTSSIAIPNVMNDGIKVTQLGDSVFPRATWLESVTFAEGLESIGERAFESCTNLNCEITFPSTLKSIGAYAFYSCSGISANLDDIVAQKITMGRMAFYGCINLTGDIQAYVDNILTDSDTVITDGMFSGFSGLTGTLTIPARIVTIEANAFSGCSSVGALVFENTEENPSKLTTIGDYAFYKCSSMAGALTIPDTVTSIGSYAFSNCSSFTSLTLPNAVTSIESYAFNECTGMTGTLTIPSTISTINNYVFYCCSFTSITFATGGSGELVIGTGSGSTNCYAFAGSSSVKNTTLTTVTLPSDRNTKIIGTYAFQYCTVLETINNVETTGTTTYGLYYVASYTFQYCYLLKTLPSQTLCTTIGDFAYYNCYQLGYTDTTEVTGYSNCTDIIKWLSNSMVTTVGASAFKNGNTSSSSYVSYLGGNFTGTITKTNETTLTPGAGAFTGTHVENTTELDLTGYTEIAESEFAGVTKFSNSSGDEITEIVIPKTVTKIGSKAFAGCTSITSVTFEDSSTLESWGTYTFYECSSLKYCEIPTGKIGTDSDGNTTYGISSIPNYTFAYSGLTSIRKC